MRIRVYDLLIDEVNETEFWAHGVRVAEPRQVLDNEPQFLPNKKGHAAPVCMIGPTFGGRFLTIPIEPTVLDGVWRPASAWDSSDYELARYNQARGATRALGDKRRQTKRNKNRS